MRTADRLFGIIEGETGLTREQITSEARNEELVYARRIVCYCLNEERVAHGLIARALKRDVTRIKRMIGEHESLYMYDAKFRALFDAVTVGLKEEDIVIRFKKEDVYGI